MGYGQPAFSPGEKKEEQVPFDYQKCCGGDRETGMCDVRRGSRQDEAGWIQPIGPLFVVKHTVHEAVDCHMVV